MKEQEKDLKHELEEDLSNVPKKIPNEQPKNGHK